MSKKSKLQHRVEARIAQLQDEMHKIAQNQSDWQIKLDKIESNIILLEELLIEEDKI